MFFDHLHILINTSNFTKKANNFFSLHEAFLTKSIILDHNSTIQPLITPSYAPICHIVPPQNVPKRKSLNTPKGLATFIHAVMHIEYSAIDMALDAVYRFRNLPWEYYRDWLEVAKEEIEHFKLLDQVLQSLGYRYGDFPVHNSLFEALQKNADIA